MVVALLLTLGIVLGGSDSPWFPIPNIVGVICLFLVTLKGDF